MTADGLVFVCGSNEEVELGVGDTENRVVLTLVREELQGRQMLQVAAGLAHTVCVTEDQWGSVCIRLGRCCKYQWAAGCGRYKEQTDADIVELERGAGE